MFVFVMSNLFQIVKCVWKALLVTKTLERKKGLPFGMKVYSIVMKMSKEGVENPLGSFRGKIEEQ